MSVLRMPDGRDLDVQVSGPPEGRALLVHHGTPGSATPLRLLTRAAHARGVRVVSWSRPGYAASTRRSGRSVGSVAADAQAVLDLLGIEQAVTLGWSGGGPHALACGALLAGRVRSVLVVAGVGPSDGDGLDFLAGMGQDNLDEFGAAVEGEGPLRAYLETAAVGLREAAPADLVAEMGSLLPQADRACLAGEMGDDLVLGFRESTSTGVDGWVDDDLAFIRPWGFDPATITVPVSLWQGDVDLMVPLAHGRWLAERMPRAAVHLRPGEGHLSIWSAVESMLDELLAPLG